MKKVLILLLASSGGLLAQSTTPGAKPTPRPTTEQQAAAFAVRAPDEGSPFFSERQAAQFAMSREGQQRTVENTVSVYPLAKNSPDSASTIFKNFFTEMFSSVKLGALRGEKTTEKITLEPADVSLQDRREVDAIYTIRNNTGKIIRFDYGTTQRMDIQTLDASGKVIDKWSDDRAFEPQEGIVILNPKERLEYNAKIPTRDMKADETYTIQAEVTGYPDYNATKTVTPTP